MNPVFTVDRKQHVAGIKGRFGHLGQYSTQIFLRSVTDSRTQDLLGSVYKVGQYEPME